MGMTYKRFPICQGIQKFRKGLEVNFIINNEETNKKLLKNLLGLSEVMRFSLQITSQIEKREFKFMKDISKFLSLDLSSQGCIITNKDFCLLFEISFDEATLENRVTVFTLTWTHNTIICVGEFQGVFKKGMDDVNVRAIADDKLSEIITEKGMYYCVQEVIEYVIFKKFAPIETKLVKAGRTNKKKGKRKENTIGLDVTQITSTWFTNIIRTEGFNVSGHFRLQPCGKGMKDRKLIWIKDFKKNGYSRTASKEI